MIKEYNLYVFKIRYFLNFQSTTSGAQDMQLSSTIQKDARESFLAAIRLLYCIFAPFQKLHAQLDIHVNQNDREKICIYGNFCFPCHNAFFIILLHHVYPFHGEKWI